MPRFLRGLDELLLEVVAVGLSAVIFIVLASRGLNSATAHRADNVPIVGTIIAGSRAAINTIASH